MKKNEFKWLDLAVLSILAIVFDFIGVKLSLTFHTVFIFNVVYTLILMIMVRWGKMSWLPIFLIALVRGLIITSFTIPFLVSTISVLLLIPLLEKSKEKQISIIQVLGYLVALIFVEKFTYALFYSLMNSSRFITNLIQVLSNDLLNIIINAIVLVIIYKQKNLLIYMPSYLNDLGEGSRK